MTSLLRTANELYRQGEFAPAVCAYVSFLQMHPELVRSMNPGLIRARDHYRKARQRSVFETPDQLRVGVCGWEMGHNAAGRVYTLAQLYEKFSDVQMMGCLFSPQARDIWEPIRDKSISCEILRIDETKDFLALAIDYVAANPLDWLHLSKPRAPNILLGLLYKCIWKAVVLVDVDDEELGFVGAQEALTLESYLDEFKRLPNLSEIHQRAWTQLGVGLSGAFDGVTVANSILQKRYGGEIVAHARDESRFVSSAFDKVKSRDRLGLPQHKKVVMFFGTPRAHKGVFQIAKAISLIRSNEILFAVVGRFPDPSLQRELRAVSGVDYCFLDNQPFDEIANVISTADAVVLLQDTDSLVGQFQIPAKLSDALAMGVPVLASRTPPLAHAIAVGAVEEVDASTLPHALGRLLFCNDRQAELAANGRRYFETHLSFATNAPALQRVVAQVQDRKSQQLSMHPNLLALSDALGNPLIRSLVAA